MRKSTKPATGRKPVSRKPAAKKAEKPVYKPIGTYAGPSGTDTKAAKRVPLVTRPFANYTYRTDTRLRDMHRVYSDKPFSHSHNDKAVCEYLAFGGLIESPEPGKLKLTKAGIAFATKYPALQPGDKLPYADFIDARDRVTS